MVRTSGFKRFTLVPTWMIALVVCLVGGTACGSKSSGTSDSAVSPESLDSAGLSSMVESVRQFAVAGAPRMLAREVDFFFSDQWWPPSDVEALRSAAARRQVREQIEALSADPTFQLGVSAIKGLEVRLGNRRTIYCNDRGDVWGIEFPARLARRPDAEAIGLDPQIVENLETLAGLVAASAGGTPEHLRLMAVSYDQGGSWKLAANHEQVKAAHKTLRVLDL